MSTKTWNQLTKDQGFPSRFRVVVIKEGTRFCAVVLEWYLCSSGDTIEQALHRAEHLIFAQAALCTEYRGMGRQKMKPAPKDYQRVATKGNYSAPTCQGWVSGPIPVVHRCTIDMAKSKFLLSENKDPTKRTLIAIPSMGRTLKPGDRRRFGGATETPHWFVVTKVMEPVWPPSRKWFWCQGYHLDANGGVTTIK